MSRGQPWTAEHDELLRRLWDQRSAAEIGALLFRTPNAVRIRAHYLYIGSKRRRWTDEELSLIYARYPTEYNATLAVVLGRSTRAVADCARKLGVKKGRRFLEESARRLCLQNLETKRGKVDRTHEAGRMSGGPDNH